MYTEDILVLKNEFTNILNISIIGILDLVIYLLNLDYLKTIVNVDQCNFNY